MKTAVNDFQVLNTVSDYARFYGLPAPTHPLLMLVDLAQMRNVPWPATPVVQQVYTVSLKRDLTMGRIIYGHKSYDFSEGVLSFLAPGQGCWAAQNLDLSVLDVSQLTGWTLVFHPDLLARYPLGKKIAGYSFFSYETNEALHLSGQEEAMLDNLIQSIKAEYDRPIDDFSQDVLVSQIEVLLNYANRFYNRQFITRRTPENDLLSRFEVLLTNYFTQTGDQPLPTVQYFADGLSVSSAYLSDMLRTLTGQNTQQHIHHALIEKAKRLLLGTSLTVNETAYQLGFEYPQYFSRLFKSKTGFSPAQFRHN